MEKKTKKKNKIVTILFVLILLSNFIHAGSISFSNPEDGEFFRTGSYINLRYTYSTTASVWKIIMTDHNGNTYDSNSDDGIPQWWTLSEEGAYDWKLELYVYNYFQGYKLVDDDEITFYVKHSINVRNNFGLGSSKINIDGLEKTSGTNVLKLVDANLNVGAISPQTYNGDIYVWKINGNDKSDWERKPTDGNYFALPNSNVKNYSYTVVESDNGTTIKGNLRIHTLPTTPTISMSGGWGSNPILSFSGGGSDVDYYILKKEYDFGSGFNTTHYVNPASNPYTDQNVVINRFGGDVTARYSVKVVDIYGYESSYSSTVSTIGNSAWKKNGDEQDTETIKTYTLNSNYPNPFNPTTQISYKIPKNSFVNLVVYNALGQEVATLVNQYQSSGEYSIQFNATNLPSGVYIYKLQADNYSDVKKMLLLQ